MKNKLSFLTLFGILFFSVAAIGQPYCNSSYTFPWQDYISNVSFNTITNPSGPTSYSDFTALNTNVDIGSQYALNTTIVNFAANPIYVQAWIDWNQDFDFVDPGETFYVGSVVGPTFGTNISINITVPAGATLGATRMRISAARGFYPDPCNSAGYLYGETEDYALTIVSPALYVYWDGEIDNRWEEPLNWDGDVIPEVTDPVVIPGGMPNYPLITASTLSVGADYNSPKCQSVLVEDGGSIDLPWGVLNIFEDVTIDAGGRISANRLLVAFGGNLFINGGELFVNNTSIFQNGGSGTLNSGSFFLGTILEFSTNAIWSSPGGTIICQNGLNTEIINHNNALILSNLLVESGCSASVSGSSTETVYIYGNFTIEPGASYTLETPAGGGNTSAIVIGQGFNIEGNSSNKGSFIDESGSSFLSYGATNVDSYYAEDRWHFISSPVTSAVSGVFLDLYLKAFDETNNEYTPSPGITSTTYPLGIGQGFETFSDVGNGSPTISYVGGQLNTGDISPSFTATDISGNDTIGAGEGWNLIGNPYPSAIDIGTENDPVSGYTWTNVDSTVYAWNGTGWSSFNMAGNGTGVNGGTRYLPSMQGYFLKANDLNPVFGFANSARLHSAQANYKTSINDNYEIRLVVEGNGYSDEIIIRAIENASNLFDSKYDAYKLPGLVEVPQLYSKAGLSDLSINTLPEFTEESIVPVYIEVGASGIYSIEANDFDLSELSLTAYLEDLKEEYIIMLDENSLYEFSANKGDDEHRFNLKFNKADDDEVINSSSIQIFSNNDVVHIRKEVGVNAHVFVYDLMGREVTSRLNNSDSDLEIKISTGVGNYIVKVITDSYIETKKVFIN